MARTTEKPLTDLDRYEARIVAGAVSWTAFLQLAPGDRRRADHRTFPAVLDEARRQAAHTTRSVLVYATDDQNHDVMVGRVDAAGAWVPATRIPVIVDGVSTATAQPELGA